MATWQFQVTLVPEDVVKKQKYSVGTILSGDQLDFDWWNRSDISEALFHRLESDLPRGRSWSEDLDVFGDLESTNVEVYRNKDSSISGVLARFDLRSIDKKKVNAVLQFAKMSNSLLITESGKIIHPAIEVLRKELKDSPAYRFITDPEAFLYSLREDSN